MRILLLLIIFLLGTPVVSQGIQRYALITGSNNGGAATGQLKFAGSDAKKISEVLIQFGGLKAENLLVLINPEKESIDQGLNYIRSKVQKNISDGEQVQFIFYYSGHSNTQGLKLFDETYSYSDLRSALALVQAEVQIVILDSCSSGAFTRNKGGEIIPPFLQDTTTEVAGYAYLTSSTADEVSQESDKIQSSFFTHSLINALRGAADSNGDGSVTLNETYQYTYDKTLQDTQNAQNGAQHPAFDINLNGQGNLVMTDLRKTESVLDFPESLEGRLMVRDITNNLLIEVQKKAGSALRLGVEQGYYRLFLETSARILEMGILVDEKKTYPVDISAFQSSSRTRSIPRGEFQSPFVPFGFRVFNEKGLESFHFDFLGSATEGADGVILGLFYNKNVGPLTGYQGSSLFNYTGVLMGMQGSLVGNFTDGDSRGVQAAFGFNHIGGDFDGVQISLVNHVSLGISQAQIGGVNIAGGRAGFLQLGLFNYAPEGSRGLQLLGINYSGGDVLFQTGLGNWASGSVGLGQFAFLFNYAKSLVGLQVGLVNYSEDMTGVQLGLINISKSLKGIPIGLIDIQFNGENRIDLVLETLTREGENPSTNLFSSTYLRLGSEYFYKYLTFGMRLHSDSTPAALPLSVLGAGLGFRIPIIIPTLAVHLDGGVNFFLRTMEVDFTESSAFIYHLAPQFRLFTSYRFMDHFGVLAGFNLWFYTKNFHEGVNEQGRWVITTGAGKLLVDPRFFIGIQI